MCSQLVTTNFKNFILWENTCSQQAYIFTSQLIDFRNLTTRKLKLKTIELQFRAIVQFNKLNLVPSEKQSTQLSRNYN